MNTLPIILSAIIAFAATLSAGILVKKFRRNIGIVCAFAAGCFIALSIFDLLPDILALAPQTQISTLTIFISAAIGFAFLLSIDRGFSRFHPKDHEMSMTKLRPKIGMISTAEFCSHAYLEGLAIGISFQLAFSLGILVAVAVVSHDFCDGINTLALMLNSGNSLKSSLTMLIVDAFAPVLGALTTLFLVIGDYFVVFSLSFLVGSFLYMGGGSLLPDAYRMNRLNVTVGFFLLGFLLILLFARIAA